MTPWPLEAAHLVMTAPWPSPAEVLAMTFQILSPQEERMALVKCSPFPFPVSRRGESREGAVGVGCHGCEVAIESALHREQTLQC